MKRIRAHTPFRLKPVKHLISEPVSSDFASNSPTPHGRPAVACTAAPWLTAAVAVIAVLTGLTVTTEPVRASETATYQVDEIATPGNRLPQQMDFTYTVSRGNIELGEILSTLKKAGDNYQSVTTTRPNSLIKMLGADDIRQETEFSLTADGFASISYLESRSDRPDRRVSFDDANGLIHFSVAAGDKDKDGEMRPLTHVEKRPDYDTVDIGSLPFYLMTKPIFELSGNRLGIVTGKKIGHYKIEEPVAELMQTPLGELKTWRIENQPIKTPPEPFPATASWSAMGTSSSIETGTGTDGSLEQDKDDAQPAEPKNATSIIVWLSPAHNNLPVKIVKRKGSRETTLMLDSISDGNGPDINQSEIETKDSVK